MSALALPFGTAPRGASRFWRTFGRVAAALLLAALLHLSAWQSLSGIRVALPGAQAPEPTIEAALLAPAPVAVALPSRRSIVRVHAAAQGAAVVPGQVQPLTQVQAPEAGPAPPVPVVPEPPGAAAAPNAQAPAAAEPQAPAASEPPPPAAAEAPPRPPAAQPSPAPAPPSVAPLAAHGAVQVVLPRSARFIFDSNGTVRVGGFVLRVRGRTTTQWHFENGHYQSNLSIDVVNFAQTSRGLFDPDVGLAPEQYTETRHRHSVMTTLFDWAHQRVSFSDAGGERVAEAGAQDRLSIQFQLSVLRQVYPERFVRGGVVPVTLAGTRDVSHWTFTVTGEDTVDTGLGRLPALRILSNRSTETGDESLEVWLSERLNWFPVRIRIVDKNRNMIDSVLDEASID